MHLCNSRNQWVQVKYMKAVTENYKILFFVYIITIMVYVFNLFQVVTVVYNADSWNFENVQHLSSVSDSSCDIILVEFWNSSYVFRALKCVFVLIMLLTRKCFRSHFLSLFERQNKKHCIHNCWKEYIMLNTVAVQYILLFCISFFPKVTFLSMLQFIIFLGTVFEVLKVLTIYDAVWVRTPYSLVHVNECSGGSFWVNIHKQSKDGGSMPWW